MTGSAPTVLALAALLIAYSVFRATADVPSLVSPQGCRMSWMSPSYLLQPEFNTSWTPHASRYSLLLYREVGWEPSQAMGLPVLFIPGNAGSSHQVRSIASSAARQYFSSPFVISEEFTGRGGKPVDFYAAEFNEDLSAFHGPTLDSQIAYTSAAVKYILSRYPPDTQIIVMGHSMGGVVGTALLPSGHIKVLITMSTPHTLPPARFDARIDEIYDRNRRTLREDETPILSVCGGATDAMIPSESCVLPQHSESTGAHVYRRTVFSSALEGAWTGVGHREMVWCHQVRWRLARAALELGLTHSVEERVRVLDRWLRDGVTLPTDPRDPVGDLNLTREAYEMLPGGSQFVLGRPIGKRTYLVPMPSSPDEAHGRVFVLYVSQGSVLGVSPHHTSDLRVSVHVCGERSVDETVVCSSVVPSSLRLLPAPIPGKPFPAPDEGVDESEGVVFFEAEIPPEAKSWVRISVDAGNEGRGWVAGSFVRTHSIESELSLSDMLFSGLKVQLPPASDVGSRVHISLPRLPATALLVYRLVPKMEEYNSSCTGPLFSPLLVHTSQASEIHYHRLVSHQPVFLHAHSSGPYVPSLHPVSPHGLDITIHPSGPGCPDVTEAHLTIDWWASLGRIGARYPTTLLSWGVGIVSLLLFHSWSIDGQQLSVGNSLGIFARRRLPALMVAAGVTSLLPLGRDYFLGIGNELGVLGAALAVLLVGVAAGMVCVSWWLLVALMWPLGLLRNGFIERKSEGVGVRRSTVISMAFVLALIFLFVPWQVAFLGCWITQLFNCTATSRLKLYPGSASTLASTPTSARDRAAGEDDTSADRSSPSSARATFGNAHNQNTHMLLLMTWLLPLAAPVLVVWVRTVLTVGYTTPFNGDHNVFKVVPALVLVDLFGRGRPLEMTTGWRGAVRWGWIIVAAIAFWIGGRKGYVVYDMASVEMAVLMMWQMKAWVCD